MKIAVPTHRRSDLINNLTLKVLQNIDKKNIYIFISDKQDMKLYEKECAGYNLVLCNTDNATDKFNYIQNYFNSNEFVFVIEDDIKKIQSLFTSDIEKLFYFIELYCLKNKVSAFGIYPSSNKFFMSKSVDIGLTYIVANLFGFIAREDSRLLCKLKTKTDYERSMLYYKVFGAVARFNFISCLTNNYNNKGGMQEIKNRGIIETEASMQLCKMYPNTFSINSKRKSKYTELKMNKNFTKQKI